MGRMIQKVAPADKDTLEHRIPPSSASLPPTKRPIVRGDIEPEEGLQGYILRISGANGYHTPAQILPRFPWLPAVELRGLGECLGASRDRLRAATAAAIRTCGGKIDFFGSNLATRFLTLNASKFCPLCLREGPYLRAAWDIIFWVSCPVHQIMLVDRCPSCDRTPSWRRSTPTACGYCGTDISSAPQVPLASRVSRYSRLLAEAAGFRGTFAGTRLPTMFDHLSLQELCSFTNSVGGVRVRNSGRAVSNRSRGLKNMYDMVERTASIIFDWPVGFHLFLEELRDTRPLRSSILAFKRAKNIVDYRLCEKGFDFAREEFVRYKRLCWDAATADHVSSIYTTTGWNDALYVSAFQAARMVQLTIQEITERVRGGEIPGYVKIRGKKTFCIVERRWVEQQVGAGYARPIPPSTKTHLRAAASAEYLGLPSRRSFLLDQLTAAKLIKRIKVGFPYFYEISSLEALSRRIGKRSLPYPRNVSLEVMVPLGGHEDIHDFSDIVSWVLSGKLSVYFRPSNSAGVGRYLINREAVASLAARPQNTKISICDAARLLSVPVPLVKDLLRNGVLQRQRTRDGKRIRMGTVCLADVENFQSKYVASSCIAKRLGIPTRTVTDLFVSLGMRPTHTLGAERRLRGRDGKIWDQNKVDEFLPWLIRYFAKHGAALGQSPTSRQVLAHMARVKWSPV